MVLAEKQEDKITYSSCLFMLWNVFTIKPDKPSTKFLCSVA